MHIIFTFSQLIKKLQSVLILIGLLLGVASYADDLKMLTGGGTPPKPNIIFLLDSSSSMTDALDGQLNFGIPNPGDMLYTQGSTFDTSIELLVFSWDTSNSSWVTTPKALTDFSILPSYVTDLFDGPSDALEEAHLNSFATYFDSHLDYIGNQTIAGFTPRPWTQMNTQITTIGRSYFWDIIDSSEFSLANPSSIPHPPAYWLEYRYNYEGISRETVIRDLVLDSFYITNELGGANVSVMFTSDNTNGFYEPDDTAYGWDEDRFSGTPEEHRNNPPRDPNLFHDFYSNGAFVAQHFTDTTSLADTDDLVKHVRDLRRPFDYSYSPYLEALYEARLYLAGATSPWDKNGLNKYSYTNGAYQRVDWALFEATIDQNAYAGGNISNSYKSIWDSNHCGENHVIFYGDGYPSLDFHANPYIIAEMGSELDAADIPAPPYAGTRHDKNLDDTLLDEYIRYLHDTDLDTTKDGKQNIHTHLIDFAGALGSSDETVEKAFLEGGGNTTL